MKNALRPVLVAAFATGVLSPVWAAHLAMCDGVQQDRAACLHEVAAVRQAARDNGLTSEPGSYAKNASARCQFQPPTERADCEARVRGTGMTSTQGSVMGGGTITETVTPISPAGK